MGARQTMGDKRNKRRRTNTKLQRKRAKARLEAQQQLAAKNAAIVRALLTGMLRNIFRMEMLLGRWVQMLPPVGSVSETVYRFLSRIMGSPARLRIENQCLIFLECSEFRIFYKDLTPHENALLLHIVRNWHEFFGRVTQIMHTSMCPAYLDCIYNGVVEECFPRTQIACRYIAELLRINARGDAPGELGPHYQLMWMYVYKAVMALYTRGDVPDMTHIKPMLDILMKPASAVCEDWDPERAVHP